MAVETLTETFGPFLIPAVIFAVGVIAYAVLVWLTRRGLLGGGPGND
jgi:hypothetical protein